MKGFIYLLEIAVASILMVVFLSVFFTLRVKQSWDTSDLIATGNNMLSYTSQNKSFFINILNEDLEDIKNVKPPNINYGLNIKGSPKSNIVVGCMQDTKCSYIESLLTPVYVNGRWINFYLENFDIVGGIPNYINAVVLVDYTGYTVEKTNIINYLNDGGVVIGINATNGNDNDFNDIFGLNPISSAGGDLNFISYNPSEEDIPKYFLGIGFYVTREWYIWEERWIVNYIGSMINISKPDQSAFRYLAENETFDLTKPGGTDTYTFKVNKLWFGRVNRANIQPLNRSFVFEDFTEMPDVIGNKNIVSLPTGQAAMTSNGNAIWISDFPWSDEYRALVKAAIISRNDEWIAKGVYTTKETVMVSSFLSSCCDMPETAELEITLWYIV